jgi:hypothetical protein
MESPHAAVIECALQPVNEDLTRLLVSQRSEAATVSEGDILRVLTLMAGIRTRALEKGWEEESDADLGEIQTLLGGQGTEINFPRN